MMFLPVLNRFHTNCRIGAFVIVHTDLCNSIITTQRIVWKYGLNMQMHMWTAIVFFQYYFLAEFAYRLLANVVYLTFSVNNPCKKMQSNSVFLEMAQYFQAFTRRFVLKAKQKWCLANAWIFSAACRWCSLETSGNGFLTLIPVVTSVRNLGF